MRRACLSVRLSVCLSACLSPNCKHAIFSKKLSNLQLWCLLTTYRKSYKGFSKNPLLDPEIQDGWDPQSWKSTWRHFFVCRGWSDLDKILQAGAECHVDCRDIVKIETRCRIPTRRTFGRIPWHVIPDQRITLQGAATWWIHCHDFRARCHIAWCNNSIRHIENRFSPYFIIFFKMQFGLWRAAAFVSSPIHLFILVVKCILSIPINNVTAGIRYNPKRTITTNLSIDHLMLFLEILAA